MPEQEFNLLQISAVVSAELCAGSAQIVRTKGLYPNLLCRLLDNGPHGPVGQCFAFDLAALDDRTQQPTFLHIGGGRPDIDCVLDPYRNRHRAYAAALPAEISDHPTSLTQLDLLDIELSEFLSAQGAADKQRKNNVVAFAFQRGAIRNRQQILGLRSC